MADLLPTCLALDYANSTEMTAALGGRVDLRRVPTSGRVRAGVDPLGALRVSKAAPRSNTARKKAADQQPRELWISHPLVADAWLRLWVSPAVWVIARHLELHSVVEPEHRHEQLVEATSQRVADLRAVSVVIVSERVPNPRLPRGTPLVRHELVSGVRTTPPPKGSYVLEFSDELRSLTVDVRTRSLIARKIDDEAASRKQRAMDRLNRATAALSAYP